MPAGNVAVELGVDAGSDCPIEIQPNQLTPLKINVTKYRIERMLCVCRNWIFLFNNQAIGFEGMLEVIAYAVQTDGFDNATPYDIWSASVRATDGN